MYNSSGYSVKLGAQELYVAWELCYKIGVPELNYSIPWMQNQWKKMTISFVVMYGKNNQIHF